MCDIALITAKVVPGGGADGQRAADRATPFPQGNDAAVGHAEVAQRITDVRHGYWRRVVSRFAAGRCHGAPISPVTNGGPAGLEVRRGSAFTTSANR
jgi:hypothetical protein